MESVGTKQKDVLAQFSLTQRLSPRAPCLPVREAMKFCCHLVFLSQVLVATARFLR
jgi:hypothetical protein